MCRKHLFLVICTILRLFRPIRLHHLQDILFVLFILTYQQPVTHTCIIDPSVFTYDSALSFPVICVKCYIGPCGVLVPTGTVHSNSELEFEF